MYNVAHYLEKCINNIQIKDVAYEVLMINDGSPDNSLEVANQLKKNNPNITILSQENKGLGGARNLGIKNAKGKYVLFLDADDVLIKQDYQFLANEDADVIEYSSKNIDVNHNIISVFKANNVLSKLDGISYYENNPSMFSACNKLYANAFLNKYQLYFKEHIYIEDFEFNTRAFLLSQSIKSSSEVVQHFIQMPNSITRNNDKTRKIKLVNDMLIVAKSIQNFANKIEITNQTFVNDRLTWLTVDIIYHSLKNKLGSVFLNEKINELKTNNLFHLDGVLRHNQKDLFRRILKIPLGLFMIKLILNGK